MESSCSRLCDVCLQHFPEKRLLREARVCSVGAQAFVVEHLLKVPGCDDDVTPVAVAAAAQVVAVATSAQDVFTIVPSSLETAEKIQALVGTLPTESEVCDLCF